MGTYNNVIADPCNGADLVRRQARRRHRAVHACTIRQHTSAYVSVRQHTSAYVSIRQISYEGIPGAGIARCMPAPYVSIRQRTSAYVSIRQHTSAYVRSGTKGCQRRQRAVHACYFPARQHTSATSAYVSVCQHSSAYVCIREHRCMPATCQPVSIRPLR